MLWIFFDDFPFGYIAQQVTWWMILGGWRVHPGYLTLSILLSEKSMIFVKPWNTIPYSTVISWDTCRFLTLLKYMWLLSLFLILLALLIEKEFKSWLHRCTEREREREIEMCCFPSFTKTCGIFLQNFDVAKSKNFRIPVVGNPSEQWKKGALVV